MRRDHVHRDECVDKRILVGDLLCRGLLARIVRLELGKLLCKKMGLNLLNLVFFFNF